MLKKLFLIIAIILILPSVNAEDVMIQTPDSYTAGTTIHLIAHYRIDNSIIITNADCILNTDFLDTSETMTYFTNGQYYSINVYISDSGNQKFEVTCNKTSYNEATKDITLNIPKSSSNLNLNYIPTNTNIGNTITFEAYYNHITLIPNANCNLEITNPLGVKNTHKMKEYSTKYSIDHTITDTGNYAYKIDCSSKLYTTQTTYANIQSNKKSSQLYIDSYLSDNYYTGDSIKINYNYLTETNNAILDANCKYILKKSNVIEKTGTLTYNSNNYILEKIIEKPGYYELATTCKQDNYETLTQTNYFNIIEIPTTLNIDFDSYNTKQSFQHLTIQTEYLDTRTNQNINNADCSITFLEKETKGNILETTIPAINEFETKTIDICCSKKYHQTICKHETINLEPQNININLHSDITNIVANEPKKIIFIADTKYATNTTNIECSLTTTHQQNNAEINQDWNLKKTNNEYTTDILIETAGYATLKIICFGEGYHQNLIDTGIKVKTLNKKTEKYLTNAFSILLLVLILSAFLIRSKYKV